MLDQGFSLTTPLFNVVAYPNVPIDSLCDFSYFLYVPSLMETLFIIVGSILSSSRLDCVLVGGLSWPNLIQRRPFDQREFDISSGRT